MEVFPEYRLSRITTAASRLELFGSPSPQVVNGQVVISRESGQEEASLSVSPEGSVVFGYVSTAPAASDSAPDTPTTAPQRPPEPLAAAQAGDGRWAGGSGQNAARAAQAIRPPATPPGVVQYRT